MYTDCIDLTVDDSEDEEAEYPTRSNCYTRSKPIDIETDSNSDSDIEFVSAPETPSSTTRKALSILKKTKRSRSRSRIRSVSPASALSSTSLISLESPPRTLKTSRKFNVNVPGDHDRPKGDKGLGSRFSTPAGPSVLQSGVPVPVAGRGDNASPKKGLHTVISAGGTLEEGTPQAPSSKPFKSRLFLRDSTSKQDSGDSDIEVFEPSPLLKSSSSRHNVEQFETSKVAPRSKSNTRGGTNVEIVDLGPHIATSKGRPIRTLDIQKGEGPSSIAAAISEDELLARKLQAQERKEYRELIAGIANKKEGIVFRTVINAADGTLEDGSPAHPDDLERFEPWKKLFEDTSFGKKVKRFHWIVNYELEKRFEEAKESLMGTQGIKDPQELLLFHGTNPANIDSILESGFRIGGVGGQPVINGTALGYGVYLATQSATSVGYALGGDRIFACRVFPGRITSDARYSMKPPQTTNPLDEQYHTFMSGGVYVVRYASLLVPCYMIEFEQPQYLLGGAHRPGVGIGMGMGIGKLGMGMGTGMGAAGGRARAPTRRQPTKRSAPRKTATTAATKVKTVPRTRAAAAAGKGKAKGKVKAT